MHFNLSSLAALVAAFCAVAAQPATGARSLNPPPSKNRRVDLTALPPADITPATNAKRFAQGLPPLSPVKRRPHRGGPHRDGGYPNGGTHVVGAPRAETSSTPSTSVQCNILVKTTGGSTLGYISPVFNDYGEYGTPQAGQAGALEVSFPSGSSSTGSIDMVASSPPATIDSFPYLSGAMGFMSDGDDLGPGNANYVVITGNAGSTGSGATPSSSTGNSYATRTGQDADSETAIWTYDPATQAIQAVWTNTDGSSAPTKLVYFIDTDPADGDANTLVATGDLAAFQAFWPCTDTCPEVTFTCVTPLN